MHVEVEEDPSVLLNFSLTGSSSPTHVTVSSTTLTFAPLTNPTAFATAAVTVTDTDSSLDGATVTGLLTGTKAYEASYGNGTSLVPFADLVSPVTAATDSSNTSLERYPTTGGVTIFDTVSSIQSKFDFNLSANDSASGTSRFNVTESVPVPEPSSVVLAGMGLIGLAAVRRHRKSVR